MLSHPLTKFDIKRYQNKIQINGVYSGNNLPNNVARTAHQVKDEIFKNS